MKLTVKYLWELAERLLIAGQVGDALHIARCIAAMPREERGPLTNTAIRVTRALAHEPLFVVQSGLPLEVR